MNETDFKEWLVEVIYEGMESLGEEDIDISTFGEKMLVTDNEGLVIRFEGGEEFQVTIVQSR